MSFIDEETNSVGLVNPTADNSNASIPTPISIYELYKRVPSSSRLSDEGVKYATTIADALADKGITMYTVTCEQIEARVYASAKDAGYVVVLFNETYQAGPLHDAPCADFWRQVTQKFQAEHPEYTKFLQSILITADEYGKVKQMISIIDSIFATAFGNISITSCESFRNARFSIVTNINSVRRFVEQHSPHVVPARDDYGVLVCLDVNTKKKNQYGSDIIEQKPILAITGYTRFLNPAQTNNVNDIRNVPLAIITDIVSDIPSPYMLPLAIAVGVDAFIGQDMCFNPYRNFADKSQPQLGSLFVDENGHLEEITNIQRFNQVREMGFVKPFIAIDITEGRARLVGIDQMVKDAFVMGKKFFNFFGLNSDMLKAEDTVVGAPFYNFIGTVRENGKQIDSRKVDYLKLVTASPSGVAQYMQFLRQDLRDPEIQLNNIREVYGTEAVEPLYITTTIILNAVFVDALRSKLNELVKVNYDQPQCTSMSLTPFYQTKVGNMFNFAGVGGSGSAMNYFGNNYGADNNTMYADIM